MSPTKQVKSLGFCPFVQLWKSTGSINCVQQKNEIHTGLKQIEVE